MKQAQRPRSTALSSLFRKLSLPLAASAITASLPINANAASLDFASTITRLYSYSNGDIIIQLVNPPVNQCSAFWLSPSDAGGFKNSYAMLLSAYHTQAIVRLEADDAQLWSGSGQPHCRVKVVALD